MSARIVELVILYITIKIEELLDLTTSERHAHLVVDTAFKSFAFIELFFQKLHGVSLGTTSFNKVIC